VLAVLTGADSRAVNKTAATENPARKVITIATTLFFISLLPAPVIEYDQNCVEMLHFFVTFGGRLVED
jgi:hypothetical protein